MYLQLFIFELQQSIIIIQWVIEWISNVVQIWTLNTHKNWIWLSDKLLFFDKDRQSYKKSCIKFLNLRFKNKILYEFLTKNNLLIFVICMYRYVPISCQHLKFRRS